MLNINTVTVVGANGTMGSNVISVAHRRISSEIGRKKDKRHGTVEGKALTDGFYSAAIDYGDVKHMVVNLDCTI